MQLARSVHLSRALAVVAVASAVAVGLPASAGAATPGAAATGVVGPSAPAGGLYVPVTPVRVGSEFGGRARLPLAGRYGVPRDVRQALVAVTVAGNSAARVVDGRGLPVVAASAASAATQDALLPLGADGALPLTWSPRARVVVDLLGYLTPGAVAPGGSRAIAPDLVMDTSVRLGGGPLSRGQTRSLKLGGRGQVPVTGVSDVRLLVAATSRTGATLALRGAGTPAAAGQQVKVLPGLTTYQQVDVPTITRPDLLLDHVAGGPVQLTVLTIGVTAATSSPRPGALLAVPPHAFHLPATDVPTRGRVLTALLGGRAGLPSAALAAVAAEVTAGATSRGSISAAVDPLALRGTTLLSTRPRVQTSVRTLLPVDASGRVQLGYDAPGRLDLVVRVVGYVTSAVPAAPAGPAPDPSSAQPAPAQPGSPSAGPESTGPAGQPSQPAQMASPAVSPVPAAPAGSPTPASAASGSPAPLNAAALPPQRPRAAVVQTTGAALTETGRVQFAGVVPDAAAGIAGIRLYLDGTLIGTGTIDRTRTPATWSFAGTPPESGSADLTVEAVDNAGQTSSSTQSVVLERPAPDDTFLTPDAVGVPPSFSSQVLRADTATVVVAATQVPYSAGQVLVFGVTPATPEGLLVRVREVVSTGDTTVMQVAPALLTDAFAQLRIADTRNDAPATASVHASGRTRSRLTVERELPFELNLAFPLKKSPEAAESGGSVSGSLNAGLTIKGSLVPSVTTEITVECRWSWAVCHPQLKHFKAGAQLTTKAQISVYAEGTGSGEYNAPLLEPVPLPDIVIPTPIPFVEIVITPSFELGLKNTLEAKGAVRLGLPTWTRVLGGYLTYDDGQFGSAPAVREPDPDQPPLALELDGSVELFDGLEGKLNTRLYGLAGPFLAVTVGPKESISAAASTSGGRCFGWQYGIGLEASVGIEAEISAIGLDLSYETTPYEHDFIGDKHECEAFPLPEPDPTVRGLAVDATGVREALVGVQYAGDLLATGGRAPYVWTLGSGALPVGLTLSPAGRIEGVATTEGTSSATVRVTDAAGAIKDQPLEVRVSRGAAAPVVVDDGFVLTPSTPCGGACATTWGDPHLVTFDHAVYDFQEVGEFTLLRSTTDDLEVQVRQAPYGSSRAIAMNTAVAMQVAGHRIGVYADGSSTPALRVDGVPTQLPSTARALTGGGSVAWDAPAGQLRVTWPDGTYVTARSSGALLDLSVGLAAGRLGSVQGLFGDGDGSPTDDLRVRDGEALSYPAVDQVQVDGAYADSWRVSAAGSLFDYGDGQDTGTFTNLAFPYAKVDLAALPSDAVAAATTTCRNAGLEDRQLVDACALDYAMTGDLALVSSAGSASAFVSQAPGATPTPTSSATPTVSIAYPTFSAADTALQLNGSATIADSVLRLTPAEGARAGAAFFSSPIRTTSSFSTRFGFDIHDSPGTPADGLALVLQNDPRGASAVGGGGVGLGYDGLSPSVEVEFDVYANGGVDDANHVGLVLNGEPSQHQAVASPAFPLYGSPRTAWVDYNADTHRVRVYLSTDGTKPTTPLLDEPLDLDGVLGDRGFVGFTAGTGGAAAVHDVTSWTLD